MVHLRSFGSASDHQIVGVLTDEKLSAVAMQHISTYEDEELTGLICITLHTSGSLQRSSMRAMESPEDHRRDAWRSER
jgi:hypothetical protein